MKSFSDQELAETIISDKYEETAAKDILDMLNKERSKSQEMQDFKKIAELTHVYAEVTDTENKLTSSSDEEISKILKLTQIRTTGSRPKFKRKFKALLTTGIAAAFLIGANCISVYAFNMNIFSAIIHMTKGGFSVEFKEPEKVELPTSENDPYGIIAECAKYDIYPETPHYLPEGFYLEHTEHNTGSAYNLVMFVFNNADKESIAITYTLYHNQIGQIGIPSDEYNISETTVNGTPAIVSKEDNQFTIAYIKDKTKYMIFTQDLDYEECDKIVDSIK